MRLDYLPRAAFRPFHARTQRFALLLAHRRAGKTVACLADLLLGALACRRARPRYAYVAPLRVQAKSVAWDQLLALVRPLPETEISRTDLWVRPGGTEARLSLHGADDPDSLRGVYFDGVVLDEMADHHPRLWPEIVRPALSDRLGWAAILGTPRGPDHFQRLWEAARTDPTWFTARLPASETCILSRADLAAARAALTPEQYDQEYECSFAAAAPGAYYARALEAAEAEGRIGVVPPAPALPVTTAWDLGMADATAIWCVQPAGAELRVIDYVEGSGEALPWYAAELERRRAGWGVAVPWGEHLLPHDAAVRELGTGLSRRETLAALGLPGRVLPAASVAEGIHALRTLLPRMRFDAARCAPGLAALRGYRRRWDPARQSFDAAPLHDWTSHGADALRSFAVGFLPAPADGEAPGGRRTGGGGRWLGV